MKSSIQWKLNLQFPTSHFFLNHPQQFDPHSIPSIHDYNKINAFPFAICDEQDCYFSGKLPLCKDHIEEILDNEENSAVSFSDFINKYPIEQTLSNLIVNNIFMDNE